MNPLFDLACLREDKREPDPKCRVVDGICQNLRWPECCGELEPAARPKLSPAYPSLTEPRVRAARGSQKEPGGERAEIPTNNHK